MSAGLNIGAPPQAAGWNSGHFYNRPMFRRCLVALFALHFLLSLGGFTLHLPAPALTESALTADADGLGSSVQHGLTDDAPDMPDGPLHALPVVRVSLPPLPTTPWVSGTRDDPLPMGLDRPPRRPARA